MATECTREWTDFFIGSGVPVEVASSYALIFYENRIQKNMLLDLNKEYLTDMGITVMGDVIAILRYAKVIHKKYVSEKILVEQSKATALDHEKSTGGNVFKTTPIRKSEVNMQLNDVEMKGSHDPKLRNILPEYKGSCNIKMPKVLTEKCRRISEQMPRKREMKTVFERLGESSVSSTTSEILPGNLPTNSLISSNSSSLHKDKNMSVFSRLGEKTTSVVSSTSSSPDSGESQFNLAIFKSGSFQKKKATMRADDEQHKNIVKKSEAIRRGGGRVSSSSSSSLSSSSTSTSIKNRLGSLMSEGKSNFSAKRVANNNETRSNNKSFDGDSNDGENNKKFVKNPSNKNKGVPMLKKATMTSAQIQRLETTKGMRRKRKMNSELVDPDGNSFCKKVRFGSTTLRLIPSSKTTDDVKQSSHIEIIGNGKKPDLKIRSVKESIRERMNTRQTEGVMAKKRNYSIRDRLG